MQKSSPFFDEICHFNEPTTLMNNRVSGTFTKTKQIISLGCATPEERFS